MTLPVDVYTCRHACVSAEAGGAGPRRVEHARRGVGVGDQDLPLETVGVDEEQRQHRTEVGDEAIRRAAGHEPPADLLERLERPNAKMSTAFVVALVRYDWPFNVRELFAVLRRAVALCPAHETLDTKHLPEELLAQPTSGSMPVSAGDRPDMPTAAELEEALRANDGNVAAVSRIFKRDRSLIHRWLKQHGLDPTAFRK